MTTDERVVNIRDLPWPLPDDVVYIGRGGFHRRHRLAKSVHGNPYRIDSVGRTAAVRMFRTYAEATLRMAPHWLDPLIGKRLACHCSPDECHGHVLIELVRRIEDERQTGWSDRSRRNT